ncbi:hypothetical protein [Burkholderia pseudomultivorans]|uniref:hypothetical protein n=1 Tax=Burkholderia pseudomultivorans TaxID=1207504 RepID=UPI0012D8F7F9|nr:hypothetical protein [Burkholderia pseudomultivorans]
MSTLKRMFGAFVDARRLRRALHDLSKQRQQAIEQILEAELAYVRDVFAETPAALRSGFRTIEALNAFDDETTSRRIASALRGRLQLRHIEARVESAKSRRGQHHRMRLLSRGG